ncbi:MAG: transposase [Candidatus Promineifilaceae bacterium]
MTKRRQYMAAFKARVVLEVISGAKSQAELARQHGIKPDLIGRWRRHFLENAPRLFEQETNGSSESQHAWPSWSRRWGAGRSSWR